MPKKDTTEKEKWYKPLSSGKSLLEEIKSCFYFTSGIYSGNTNIKWQQQLDEPKKYCLDNRRDFYIDGDESKLNLFPIHYADDTTI